MLPAQSVETIPEFFDSGMHPQIINMPVWSVRVLKMMGKTGTNPSWPKCAANVNIEAKL